jgi:uncharacterized protein
LFRPVAFLLLPLLCAVALTAQVEVPANDGWVTDLADLLTPAEERELEALMESYRQGTTHEIALLTVPDLGGQPIERFALEVARTWKIGREGENNGALLVVARDDRKIRIEVGRGLEGSLTDSIAGRIIRNVIAPAFKQGDFHAGIRGGIEAMHAAIGGDYAAIPEQAPRSRRGFFGPFIAMTILFAIFLLLAGIAGGRGGGRGRRRRGSSWPWWLLAGTAIGSGGRRGGGLGGFGGGGFGGGGFGGFGGGGGFSGGGASGGW